MCDKLHLFAIISIGIGHGIVILSCRIGIHHWHWYWLVLAITLSGHMVVRRNAIVTRTLVADSDALPLVMGSYPCVNSWLFLEQNNRVIVCASYLCARK